MASPPAIIQAADCGIPMSFLGFDFLLPVERAQLREEVGIGQEGNYISTSQDLKQNHPEEIRANHTSVRRQRWPSSSTKFSRRTSAMRRISATRESCRCHRHVASPSSPAWMQG